MIWMILLVQHLVEATNGDGAAVTRNETTVDQTVVSGDIGMIPCHLIFTV